MRVGGAIRGWVELWPYHSQSEGSGPECRIVRLISIERISDTYPSR